MNNFDNKLNINNVRNTYKPNRKKDDTVSMPKSEEIVSENIGDGTKAAESYGRILVNKGSVESAETVKSVQDSLEFLAKHPTIVAAALKAGDDAYDLLLASGVEQAYEKSCVGSCEAAYSDIN